MGDVKLTLISGGTVTTYYRLANYGPTIDFPEWVVSTRCETRTFTAINRTRHGIIITQESGYPVASVNGASPPPKLRVNKQRKAKRSHTS